MYSSLPVVSTGINADYGQNSVGTNSNAEINWLLSELNSRLSRELDGIMSSVNTQIRRAISDAIDSQILPQIQTAIYSGSGHLTQNRWNVPSERPEIIPEENCCKKTRKNSRSEQFRDRPSDGTTKDSAYDMVTGENEPPIDVPEFLTGRMPSRSHLHRSHDDLNPLLNTTVPAQGRTVPAPEQDPINRLADVLTSMQDRPTAQQLTFCPVNSNTMTFDGKSEKFELFEDLFHTMIKMQPDLYEQMKINYFHSLLSKNALQTFRNISTAIRQTLEDVSIIFGRKYVKPESQATATHKWHLLVFDPNTTKLPDFLEELNQGAEKAFGDNAQKIIDSLLNAKLPPKRKRSVNMARLENGSFDEIVAHLEGDLKLNALEESDDLPMASMTSSTTRAKTVPSNVQMSDITCNYCKEKGHMVKDCGKLKKEKEKKAQQGKSTQKKVYPKCGTCGKTNHPEDRCWQGAGAHLKPKRTRPEDPSDNDPDSEASNSHYKPASSSSQSSSSKDDSKTSFNTTPI